MDYQYNNAMQNGSTLSSQQFGYNQQMAPMQSSMGSMGGPVTGANVSAGPASVGGASGGGFWRNSQGGINTGNVQLVLGGIQMLGNLWNSYQQHKIAREQMDFAKKTWKTNLKNNTQTYNTALEDRIRARHNTEGRSTGETDTYLNENRL